MGTCVRSFAIILCVLLTSQTAAATYRSELRRATERGRFYHPTDWNAELIWSATFFSDEFRKAFEARHIKLSSLDEMDRERYVALQDRLQADGWDFFLGVYTRKEYSHVTKYEDSFWKIFLKTGLGEKLAPVAVERVPITPYEKAMYPYLDRWSKAYRVTFPKAPLGDRIELVIESVVGQSSLKWKIKKQAGSEEPSSE